MMMRLRLTRFPGSELALLAIFLPMIWCWWDSGCQGSGSIYGVRTVFMALVLGLFLLGSGEPQEA